MVVAYRTQRLLHFGKSVNFSKTVPLTSGKRSIYFASGSHKPRPIGERCRSSLRLCGCRSYHSKETRPTLAKLTPQEVVPTWAYGFYKPDCEYAGLSCLDCYTQKQCINFFGLTHWTDVVCGSSLEGEANIYCDPNTDKCTSVKPDGCEAISRYTCLRDGLLPNFKDCTLYHRCVDLSAEDFICDSKYVYNHEYGKCVLKLSSDDCFSLPSCGLDDYTVLYSKDSSIYYGCSATKSFIKACKETETYNLNTQSCETRCSSVGYIPNTRNCATYYQCAASEENKLEATEMLCPEGEGYNPSVKKCDARYLNICNELVLLENDIYHLIAFTPIVEMIIQPVKTILNYFNLSPVNIIFLFGLDEQTLSDGILIIDYVYKNKQIPPTTVEIIVDIILPYLPSSVQTVLKTLMNFGIISLRSAYTPYDQQPGDIRNYLVSVLTDARIDIPQMINSFQGKNNEQVSKMIFDETMKIFKVPESQVPFVAIMLQTNMPMVANVVNEKLGMNLFTAREMILKVNQQELDRFVYKQVDNVAYRMYPGSMFLAEVFKTIVKHRYMSNHEMIRIFVDKFYFTADGLVY